MWYDNLGGYSAQSAESLQQSVKLVEMVTAQDVIHDPLGDLVTRPGFSNVRSTATGASDAFTGMFWLQDLADEFILWNGTDGKPYRDNANPPGVLAGGTAFATGANVLTRGDIFNNKLIVVSSSRNIPATIDSTPTWADLTGTPARGIDVKAFARRVCMFSPSDGTTTYRSIMSFTSANDDETKWTAPYATNFLNFGRTGTDVNVLGGEVYKDHLMVFTENKLFPVYATPSAVLPMAFQDSVFSEQGGGPPVIHAVIKGNDRLYWISRNFDVKMFDGLQVHSIGYAIQPFLRGLLDSRRVYTVGGWEPKYRMCVWAVTNSASATTNDTIIAYHVDSKQFFIHTLSVNAFANRNVSGQMRLIGGHYNGLFSNLYDSSTRGNAQTATTAIDAKIQTPLHHLGMPGIVKKVPFVALQFAPIATEAVTVGYALDDAATFTTFAEGAFTMSGTNEKIAYFTIPAPFDRIQLQVEDKNSTERFRWQRYGFPKPIAIRTSRP